MASKPHSSPLSPDQIDHYFDIMFASRDNGRYEEAREYERNICTSYQDLFEQLEAADEFKAAMVRANQRQVEQITSLREALLTVAMDAHGPGYPDEHSFNGGPVKMHAHTLMMVDEALASYLADSNPASEPNDG